MTDPLRVLVTDGVARATIDNPPVNVLSRELFIALTELVVRAEADEGIRVVVVDSANSEFFIAHFDVAILLDASATPLPSPPRLNAFEVLCERYRKLPKPVIAKIRGRIGGGGSELAMSFDMRFGDRDTTVLNQMEVGLGILPAGTGSQRLSRLVGRGRAMEIALGSDDIDARTLEAWGYLNRALPGTELTAFVDRLARRLASFPPAALAAAKAAVMRSEPPWEEGLMFESERYEELLRQPEAERRLRRFLDFGGQTPEGEIAVSDLISRLGDPPER